MKMEKQKNVDKRWVDEIKSVADGTRTRVEDGKGNGLKWQQRVEGGFV